MVAPVTLRSSHPQSASTGVSGSTNSVPTEAVSEIYCKTLSSTVGCSGTSTDSEYLLYCMYYAPVSIDYLLLYVQGTLFINCKSQHWDSED